MAPVREIASLLLMDAKNPLLIHSLALVFHAKALIS